MPAARRAVAARVVAGRFSSRGGLPLELSNAGLHLLARLEGYDEFLRYRNLFAGPWVPRFAGCTLLYLEDAKIAKLDPMVFDQRLDDRVERLLDNLLGLELGEPNLVGDGLYDLFFGHNGNPHPKSDLDRPSGPFFDSVLCSKCSCSKH